METDADVNIYDEHITTRRQSIKKRRRKIFGFITILITTVIVTCIVIIAVAKSKTQPDTHTVRIEQTTTRKVSLETPECISHEGSPTPSLDRANCILDSYPLIDGHNDLAWQYRKATHNTVYSVDLNTDLTKIWNMTHTDIPRMRKGKIGAQFWACYVDCTSQYKDAVQKSLNQLDTIKKFINRYPDVFQFVTTAQGIMDAFKAGKIGSLVGLEGGHSIDSNLANLRMFYDLGVRYLTLTHNCNTPWADYWAVDEPDYNKTVLNGTTEFGKKIILEMNRLGMMVDLSHVSKKTMIDVLKITKAPVIYSHSSAFTICPHYRNVQDDVLQMTSIKERIVFRDPDMTFQKTGIQSLAQSISAFLVVTDGVVMVNFYDEVINCGPNKTSITVLSQVADHIDYIKNLIGVEYVGVGADYDGVPTGVFMRDQLPSRPNSVETGIINLDNSTGPGTHWTTYAIDPRGIIYFDSYGLTPPKECLKCIIPHKVPVWYSPPSTRTLTDLQYAAENLPAGLEDVSTYPDLFAELIKRGWTDEELRMLAGKNLIRVFTKVEKVRDSLRHMAPYEDFIPVEEELNEQCRTN